MHCFNGVSRDALYRGRQELHDSVFTGQTGPLYFMSSHANGYVARYGATTPASSFAMDNTTASTTITTASAAAAAIRNSVIAPTGSVVPSGTSAAAAPDAEASVPNESSDPTDPIKTDISLSRLQAILLCLIFLLGIVVVAILGVCGTNGCSLPSSSKSREQQVAAYINEITATNRSLVANRSLSFILISDDELEDTALLWLVQNNTLNMLPDTPANRFRLRQRYAMATLGVQLDFNTDDECDWFYVTCQPIHLGSEIGVQNAVTEIHFDTYNRGRTWSGVLSPDLGLLTTLIHFQMAGSKSDGLGFTTTIPTQIGQWTRLVTFDVSNNALSGTLPTEMGMWSNLVNFNVSGNSGLGGRLPTEIGQWTSLETFDTHSTSYMNGTFPTEIGQWASLKVFDVSYNQFQGTLSASMEQWAGLTMLDVSNNRLSGRLPTWLGAFSHLMSLNLAVNNFQGPVPNSTCLLELSQLEADCETGSSCACCTQCYLNDDFFSLGETEFPQFNETLPPG
jgi:hypothetical protein